MDFFSARLACPICSSVSLATLVSIPYSDERMLPTLLARYQGNLSAKDVEGVSYELLYCSSCAYVFQKNVPTENMLQTLYSYHSEDLIAGSLEKRTSSNTTYYLRNARMAEKALLFCNKRPGDIRAFEYGAGWGYFALMLKAFGAQVIAFEISKERQEHLRKFSIDFVSDSASLGVGYDYAHADQVFEHLAQPEEAFLELAKCLRPGGIAYVAVPNGNRILKKLHQTPNPYHLKELYPLEHVNCFSTRALKELASRVGLRSLSFIEALPLFLKAVSLTTNAHLLQELVKFAFSQTQGTSLYFVKK